MADSYPNSFFGALFKVKDPKTNKSPIMTGVLNITPEFTKTLVEYFKDNRNADQCEVQVAGWTKESKSGSNYLSLKCEIKEEEDRQDRDRTPNRGRDEGRSRDQGARRDDRGRGRQTEKAGSGRDFEDDSEIPF